MVELMSNVTIALESIQQVQNVAPPLSRGESHVPLHLQQSQLRAENTVEYQVQTPDSKAAYVPPHLRGFNTLSKATASPSQPTPSQVQVKSTCFNIFQETQPPIKNSPVQKNGDQKEIQKSSNYGMPTVKTSPAKLQEPPAKHPVQSISEAKPSFEDQFLSFMNKKVANDTGAKKKATTEKARSTVPQPQPAQPFTADAPPSLPEVQPSILLPHRPKFVPNTASDNAFQAFLSNQINAPAANGKRYTFNGSQQSSQKLPVASKPGRNGGTTLQVVSPNQKLSASPLGKVDPHPAFSPRNLAAKTTPSFMQVLPGHVTTIVQTHREIIDSFRCRPDDAEAAGLPSSVDELVKAGFEPRHSSDGIDDRISDSGVEEKAKEDVRASQGQDPKNEFLDWDGKTWRPAPVDWETDRAAFDNSFMPKYIRQDWEPSVPRGPSVAVDIRDPKFELAVWVGEKGFESPIDHPMTMPGKFHIPCISNHCLPLSHSTLNYPFLV